MITVTYPSIQDITRTPGLSKYAQIETDNIHKKHLLFIGVSVIAQSIYEKELSKFFNYWKSVWVRDTIFSSNITEITNHPAYHAIIALGSDVLPLIFKDLIESDYHWFYALAKITGQNPIKLENQGNINEMKNDWLNWYAMNM